MKAENTKVLEQQIRSHFAPNWVFQLHARKRLLTLAITLPIVIWVTGGIVALGLGVFPVFAGNLLAYGGPILMGVGLIAYRWFAINFPRILATLYPAFDEEEPGQFENVIHKWAHRIAVLPWVTVFFVLVIALSNFADLLTLWQTTNLNWIGADWTASNQRLFFAFYYGFYNIVGGAFLLGSGAAGILGSLILIGDLLNIPIKLDYYRRLRYVSELSVSLAEWTLISFGSIFIGSILIKPNVTPTLQASTILQSVLVSIALFSILITPTIFAHHAIFRARTRKIAICEARLHAIAENIDNLILGSLSSDNVQPDYATKIEELRKERDTIRQQIQEIEAIPTWPISLGGIMQILAASGVPPVSVLLNDFISRLLR